MQNDIAQRKHDEKLFWDFFRLLFQPYGWCNSDAKYLGLKSDTSLAMFAKFYHQMEVKICDQNIENFLWVVVGKTSGVYCIKREINTTNYSNIEIPGEFRKCLEDKDFLAIIFVLAEIRERGIFDSLEHSFEEFENEVNLKDIDDEVFQIIRKIGSILYVI